jgi:hypothetical protein
MADTPDRCQATQVDPVDVTIKSQCPDGPYRLCTAAAQRLEAYALRPLEWYRLAILHGPFEFYLHDDFYEEDGEAGQPKMPVGTAAQYPVPTLEHVAPDLRRLTDFTMTRWWLRDEVVQALRHHPAAALLQEVAGRRRVTQDWWKRNRLYEICGQALGRRADAWICDEMSGMSPEERLGVLWSAAVCLDRQTAIDAAVMALAGVPPREREGQCRVLMQFREPHLLDWIEQNVTDPLTAEWGDLAAASGLDWERAASWLARGRPLSLVALDALVACSGPWPNQSLLIQRTPLRLVHPAAPDQVATVLRSYAGRDKAPRVAKAIAMVIAHLPRVCGQA